MVTIGMVAITTNITVMIVVVVVVEVMLGSLISPFISRIEQNSPTQTQSVSSGNFPALARMCIAVIKYKQSPKNDWPYRWVTTILFDLLTPTQILRLTTC